MDKMNIFNTYIVPWLIVGFSGFSIYLIVRIRNKRGRQQCPQCNNEFGKKAAAEIEFYYKHEMLDGSPVAIGYDGYIIHCGNCDMDVLFDNKNNPIHIYMSNLNNS